MKAMTVELLHFLFLGGDESEYCVHGSRDQSSLASWQDAVKRIGRTGFPTNPPDGGADVDDMVFINRPGGTPGDGIRIHCVYFGIQGARLFRNVFCFAYRNAECPLSVLASVSAEEWWNTCPKLSKQSIFVTLPCHTPPHDLPELVDVEEGYLLYRFPDRNGYPITEERTKENFEKLLPPMKQLPPDTTPTGYGGGRRHGWLWQLQEKLKRIFEECMREILVLFRRARLNVYMNSRKIVRGKQCPQCGGKRRDCSECHGKGEIKQSPSDCPYCKPHGNSPASEESPATGTKDAPREPDSNHRPSGEQGDTNGDSKEDQMSK